MGKGKLESCRGSLIRREQGISILWGGHSMAHLCPQEAAARSSGHPMSSSAHRGSSNSLSAHCQREARCWDYWRDSAVHVAPTYPGPPLEPHFPSLDLGPYQPLPGISGLTPHRSSCCKSLCLPPPHHHHLPCSCPEIF